MKTIMKSWIAMFELQQLFRMYDAPEVDDWEGWDALGGGLCGYCRVEETKAGCLLMKP